MKPSTKKSHELYGIWCAMRSRCNNPNNKSYPDYGGRGIVVCKRWDNFWNFVKDMGARPDDYTLERKRNHCGYTPKNCIWATRTAQAQNRRMNNNNTTGHTNIYKVKGGWIAYFRHNHKRVHVGTFRTIIEAKRELHKSVHFVFTLAAK